MSNRVGQKLGQRRGNIGGKLFMPSELQAIRPYVMETPVLKAVTDELREWWRPSGLNWYRSFLSVLDGREKCVVQELTPCLSLKSLENCLGEIAMWLLINLVGALVAFASPVFADSCVFSLMPPYALKSDAVNWEMQIGSGKTCTKGLKYGSVAISNVKAPPEFGKVTVQGPGFSYTAKPDFDGQDAFTLQVTGTMVRMSGTSDIQVTVSVAK